MSKKRQRDAASEANRQAVVLHNRQAVADDVDFIADTLADVNRHIMHNLLASVWALDITPPNAAATAAASTVVIVEEPADEAPPGPEVIVIDDDVAIKAEPAWSSDEDTSDEGSERASDDDDDDDGGAGGAAAQEHHERERHQGGHIGLMEEQFNEEMNAFMHTHSTQPQ